MDFLKTNLQPHSLLAGSDTGARCKFEIFCEKNTSCIEPTYITNAYLNLGMYIYTKLINPLCIINLLSVCQIKITWVYCYVRQIKIYQYIHSSTPR